MKNCYVVWLCGVSSPFSSSSMALLCSGYTFLSGGTDYPTISHKDDDARNDRRSRPGWRWRGERGRVPPHHEKNESLLRRRLTTCQGAKVNGHHLQPYPLQCLQMSLW